MSPLRFSGCPGRTVLCTLSRSSPYKSFHGFRIRCIHTHRERKRGRSRSRTTTEARTASVSPKVAVDRGACSVAERKANPTMRRSATNDSTELVEQNKSQWLLGHTPKITATLLFRLFFTRISIDSLCLFGCV